MTTKPLTKAQLGKHLQKLRTIYLLEDSDIRESVVENIFSLLVYSYLSKAFAEAVNAYERQANPDFDYVTFKGDKKSGMTPDDLYQFHRERLGFGLKAEDLFEQLLQKCQDSKELAKAINKAYQEYSANREFLASFIVTGSPIFSYTNNQELIKQAKAVSELTTKLPVGQFWEVFTKFYHLVQVLDAKRELVIPEAVAELIAQLAVAECPQATSIADPNPLAGTLLVHTAQAFEETGNQVKLFYKEDSDNWSMIVNNLLLSGNQFEHFWGDFSFAAGDFEFQCPETLDLCISYLPVKYTFNKNFVEFKESRKTKSSLLHGIPCNRATAISPLIAQILHHLDADGACFLLVPEGYLYDEADQAQRKYLLENNLVHAVISLPEDAFVPWHYTSLLVLKKNRTASDDKVMFIHGSTFRTTLESLTGSTKRRCMPKTGVDKIVTAYLIGKPKTDLCDLVPVKDLLKNGANLSAQMYRGTEEFDFPDFIWFKDDYAVALGKIPEPKKPQSIYDPSEPVEVNSWDDILAMIDKTY